ncbi:PsiF family protein [Klebsiella aerogenes]
MKITFLVTLLFGLVFVAAVSAADKTLTPQQQKMSSCNTEAASKSLKGDERKTFMSNCLKKDAPATGKTLTPQQQKMSACSKEASSKSLKGDDRNKFMSTCLKK